MGNRNNSHHSNTHCSVSVRVDQRSISQKTFQENTVEFSNTDNSANVTNGESKDTSSTSNKDNEPNISVKEINNSKNNSTSKKSSNSRKRNLAGVQSSSKEASLSREQIQSQQKTISGDKLSSRHKTVSHDRISSHQRTRTNPQSHTEADEDAFEDSENKDNLMDNYYNYEDSLINNNPVGLETTEENSSYRIWCVESPRVMRDFIEINAIPMYELSEEEFISYCKEKGWLNTAMKYHDLWMSLVLTSSRMINGIKNKFNVKLSMTDVFYSHNGVHCRALVISGENEQSVKRAFNYLRLARNYPADKKLLRYHHNELFEVDYEYDITDCYECPTLEMKIPRHNMYDQTGSHDKNTTNNSNIKMFPYYNFERFTNNNNDYFVVSLPNESVDFKLKEIHQYKCMTSNLKNIGYRNPQKQVILVKGESTKIKTLLTKLSSKPHIYYDQENKFIDVN